MTVYESIRNFNLYEMAELCTTIAITTVKNYNPSHAEMIEAQRERIREDYIRLLNDEVPDLKEGEK